MIIGETKYMKQKIFSVQISNKFSIKRNTSYSIDYIYLNELKSTNFDINYFN